MTHTKNKEAVIAWLARHSEVIGTQNGRVIYLVPSQTNAGHSYQVTVHPDSVARCHCQCNAARRGRVCAHQQGAFMAHHADLGAPKTALVCNPSPHHYTVHLDGESQPQTVEFFDVEHATNAAACSCGEEQHAWASSTPCAHIAAAGVAACEGYEGQTFEILALKAQWGFDYELAEEPLKVRL